MSNFAFRNSMNLKPRKLDIFITKQFGLLFVGTFFICQFVLMMQFVWRYIDELIGKGLTMDVLAQFFWHMGLMLVPQALPLAILLSSLITFGNLGESSELTAIKAAGIPLIRAFRSLIVISVIICFGSFYFQNEIGPKANIKLAQLLISMKQKSPELEIPEGIFYDGIPQSNIFVQRKDTETGKLYGLTICRLTGSYEDQAIILADSGMLQSTADKKYLLLTLWNGEWFENMKQQEMGNIASVPFRRETFYNKEILIPFDGDFNLTDASLLSNNARGKSLKQILHGIDSLNHEYDSIGRQLYKDMGRQMFDLHKMNAASPTAAANTAKASKKQDVVSFDTIKARLTEEKMRAAVQFSMSDIKRNATEVEFRSMIAKDGDKLIRQHQVEAIAKFTMAFSCIIFFFIGAPLGAIIRKGGLGLPVIISVLVFIVYYILDNSGTRMAKLGAWNIWFGSLLSTAVLTPLAAFITYKANNDSVVFNMDAYKEFFIRLFGLRRKRHIMGKEVIINDPDYAQDAMRLTAINAQIDEYNSKHSLRHLPNVIKVFFKYEPDHVMKSLKRELEEVIEDLSNTRNRLVLTEINNYPIIASKAHTRPFEHKWKNILSAVVVPFGVFLYIRMWRFRLRLYRDLATIKDTSNKIIDEITSMQNI